MFCGFFTLFYYTVRNFKAMQQPRKYNSNRTTTDDANWIVLTMIFCSTNHRIIKKFKKITS